MIAPIHETCGMCEPKAGKRIAAKAASVKLAEMQATMVKRRYLDTSEVARILRKSQPWIRERFDSGVFRGYRGDDGIRKITVDSVRDYLLKHGDDGAGLDDFLESN